MFDPRALADASYLVNQMRAACRAITDDRRHAILEAVTRWLADGEPHPGYDALVAALVIRSLEWNDARLSLDERVTTGAQQEVATIAAAMKRYT